MALEWMADGLRLSLFSSENMKVTQSDWTRITGKEELEAEHRARGRYAISGAFLEGQLSLSVVGSRVDCTLGPRPAAEPEGYVPSLGKWTEVSREFIGATEGWLSTLSIPIIRIAFGAGLLAAQPDLQQAYVSLLSMLRSVDGDPARMRDFMFRVNWPQNSMSINGLTLNRLTTWTVVQVQWLLFDTGANALTKDTSASPFVRLEIDHNTDGEWTQPFDPGRLVAIYRELFNLAVENAERGELP